PYSGHREPQLKAPMIVELSSRLAGGDRPGAYPLRSRELETMPQQHGLVASLIRSSAGLVVIMAAILTCGSSTDALANGKHHGHTSHRIPNWHPSAISGMAGDGTRHLSVTT